jgi:hypothetical protein
VKQISARLVSSLSLCFASFCCIAQPVYRCGNTYSQTPCPQGKLVAATDVRSAAERAEASRIAANERKLAADMRSDRLADEAASISANGRPLNIGGAESRQVSRVAATKSAKKRVVKLVVKKRPKKSAQ